MTETAGRALLWVGTLVACLTEQFRGREDACVRDTRLQTGDRAAGGPDAGGSGPERDGPSGRGVN